MQTPIHQRATELVEKGGMPWSEAESLALSEFGITNADIDELKGECCDSIVLTGDDIAALIRSVLVHGAGLLVRNPEAVAAQQPIQARELSNEQALVAFPHLYTMTLSLLPGWKQRALLDGIKTAFLAATGPNAQQPAKPAQSVPEGYALVPLRMTPAMQQVVEQSDWQWADVLAAAEAVTEQEYNEALA